MEQAAKKLDNKALEALPAPLAANASWAELAQLALYAPKPAEHPALDQAEMLRYLGYGGQTLNPELKARIECTVTKLQNKVAPRGVRQVFGVDATGIDEDDNPCIHLAGTAVTLTGRDIYRHLKDACACALMACTLGHESERQLRTLGSQHPLESAVFDAACSAYVEAAVSKMDAAVRAEAAKLGFSCNWRFSPGYGDCPLSVQPRIVATLNATRLLGLTCTATNLLLPSKSVTAMIGLFDPNTPVQSAHTRPTCAMCRLHTHCRFRERGETCFGG